MKLYDVEIEKYVSTIFGLDELKIMLGIELVLKFPASFENLVRLEKGVYITC